MKKTPVILGIVLILLGIDQGTKMWALSHLQGKAPIVIIKNVLELRYLENRGAAFGILQNQQWLFYLLTITGIGLVSFLYFRLPSKKKFRPLHVIYVLFVAGAVGNLIDRVVQGYVIDFIYVRMINFPIFNVADCCVTIAVFLFAFLFIFYYKDSDFKQG